MQHFQKLILALALLGAAGSAFSASAATLIVERCDSVTDGDGQGCLFKGNINGSTDPLNKNSYLNAEADYNALMDPDITLNWITKTDDKDFDSFGSFSGLGMTAGIFELPGWALEFYAVKAGDKFWLYEYTGGSSWSIPGKNGMSHIAFFGKESVPAVPEPGTWAMLLLGLGFIGASMRFAKRRKASLASYA